MHRVAFGLGRILEKITYDDKDTLGQFVRTILVEMNKILMNPFFSPNYPFKPED